MSPVRFVLFLLAFATGSRGEDETGFSKFLKVAREVEGIRNERLLSEEKFLRMASEEGTVILDCRSEKKFATCHIEGSLNLPFSEIDRESLRELIPDKKSRILIYCDNNFVSQVRTEDAKKKESEAKTPVIEMKGGSTAKIEVIKEFVYPTDYDPPEIPKDSGFELNIPSFITLYGYGYENIFEFKGVIEPVSTKFKFSKSGKKDSTPN